MHKRTGPKADCFVKHVSVAYATLVGVDQLIEPGDKSVGSARRACKNRL